MKALHPSDPVSECQGIPDESAVPTAHMNFMTSYQMVAPSGTAAGDTWGFDLDVLPHPVALGALHAYDSAVSHNTLAAILNTQLTGADHAAKYTTWTSYAQRWRPTYVGVTVYQDGAALTNQGTIIACQRPVHEWKMYSTVGAFNTGAKTAGTAVTQLIAFQSGDATSFETATNMPNAYIGKSMEGCYMPLIMTESCQKWHGQHDSCSYLGKISASPNSVGWTLAASATDQWPFYGLATSGEAAGNGNTYMGSVTSRLGSDIWGLICARNLDPTTSFTIIFRAGYEIQAQPGTLLSPQLHVSPQYDPDAIANYYRIRREMKDAYPADFNDWGKIWNVIKSIGRVVLPGVAMMGPIGAGVAAAAGGVGSVVDMITSAVGKKGTEAGRRDQIPLAEKQRVQEAVKAAEILRVVRPRQKPAVRELGLIRNELAKLKMAKKMGKRGVQRPKYV